MKLPIKTLNDTGAKAYSCEICFVNSLQKFLLLHGSESRKVIDSLIQIPFYPLYTQPHTTAQSTFHSYCREKAVCLEKCCRCWLTANWISSSCPKQQWQKYKEMALLFGQSSILGKLSHHFGGKRDRGCWKDLLEGCFVYYFPCLSDSVSLTFWKSCEIENTP